jgi:hypothetical protein
MVSDQVPQHENAPPGDQPATDGRSVIPVGIDSAAFAACMLTVRIPSICARVAAAASARAAQRDSTPEGIVL